jgi:hypothetical protein
MAKITNLFLLVLFAVLSYQLVYIFSGLLELRPCLGTETNFREGIDESKEGGYEG